MTLTYEGMRSPTDKLGVGTYTQTITDELIYVDTVNFASTTWQPRLMISNNEGLGLYYKIGANPDATIPTGYTIYETQLGYVGNGMVGVFDHWAGFSRDTAPVVAGTEYQEDVLPIRLSVYEDVDYSIPHGTGEAEAYLNFDIKVRWINSNDTYWSTLFNNNFDDYTQQGWVITRGSVTSSYFLSPPYSLFSNTFGSHGRRWVSTDFYKIFSLSATSAYFVFDFYVRCPRWDWVTDAHFFIGIKGVWKYLGFFPEIDGPWKRYVIPLSADLPFSDDEVRIRARCYSNDGDDPSANIYCYLDNAKIIYV